MEDYVETHLYKLRGILRSRVLRVLRGTKSDKIWQLYYRLYAPNSCFPPERPQNGNNTKPSTWYFLVLTCGRLLSYPLCSCCIPVVYNCELCVCSRYDVHTWYIYIIVYWSIYYIIYIVSIYEKKSSCSSALYIMYLKIAHLPFVAEMVGRLKWKDLELIQNSGADSTNPPTFDKYVPSGCCLEQPAQYNRVGTYLVNRSNRSNQRPSTWTFPQYIDYQGIRITDTAVATKLQPGDEAAKPGNRKPLSPPKLVRGWGGLAGDYILGIFASIPITVRGKYRYGSGLETGDKIMRKIRLSSFSLPSLLPLSFNHLFLWAFRLYGLTFYGTYVLVVFYS